jgi:hypothetical protein
VAPRDLDPARGFASLLMATAAVEVGAVRWVVPARPWIETESREPNLVTSSRAPSMVSASVKQGEREDMPVGAG